MDGHTHERYQTYYLPCYAVDKNLILAEWQYGFKPNFQTLHLSRGVEDYKDIT